MQKDMRMYVERYAHVCRKICACMQKDMSMYVERYAHVCRKICACMSNTIHADIFGHIFSLLVISLVYVICIVRVCPIQYMLISLCQQYEDMTDTCSYLQSTCNANVPNQFNLINVQRNQFSLTHMQPNTLAQHIVYRDMTHIEI